MGGGVVVFDIETQNKISDMLGADRLSQICNLQVSCLSYLVLDADRLFDPEDSQAAVEEAEMVTLWRDTDPDGNGPFERLFEAFDEAELICSYNGLGFDHPVLFKHCKKVRAEAHLLKAHDAFSKLKENTGVWFKLDNLLKANGLETKTANGLDAIKMWNEHRRDELEAYCAQDTRALARLLALPELKLPRMATTAPNYLFGIASALAAHRMSNSLKRKRVA
jgi:hypothetical protein